MPISRLRTPAVLIAATALFALLGGAPVASADSSAAQPRLDVVVPGSVNAAAVVAGRPVTFAGGGFVPGSSLQLASDGVLLMTAKADSSGAFLASPMLPAGDHTLAMRGVEPDGRQRVVTAAVAVTDLRRQTPGAARGSHGPHAMLALLSGLALVLLYCGGSLARSRLRPTRRR